MSMSETGCDEVGNAEANLGLEKGGMVTKNVNEVHNLTYLLRSQEAKGGGGGGGGATGPQCLPPPPPGFYH